MTNNYSFDLLKALFYIVLRLRYWSLPDLTGWSPYQIKTLDSLEIPTFIEAVRYSSFRVYTVCQSNTHSYHI